MAKEVSDGWWMFLEKQIRWTGDLLENYHPSIVFAAEENLDHFLDTAFTYDRQKARSQSLQETGKTTYASDARNSYKMEKRWHHWRPPQDQAYLFWF